MASSFVFPPGQDALLPTHMKPSIEQLVSITTVIETINRLSVLSPLSQNAILMLMLIDEVTPMIHHLPQLSNYESLLPTQVKPSTDPHVSIETVIGTLNILSMLAQKHKLTVFAIVQTHYHQNEDCNYTSVWYLRGPAVEGSPAWAMVHMRITSTILTYAPVPNSPFRQLIIRTKNDRELHHHQLLIAFRPKTAVEVFNEHFDVICCPNKSNIILEFMV